MNNKVDWQYLLLDTRARVYLVWGGLVTVGFVVTHYFQQRQVNSFWVFLSFVGMIYMYRVMPLKVRQMRRIFIGWLLTIIFGMIVSGVIFLVDGPVSRYLIDHLGGFWLLIMAQAYIGNGWVDKPATWYYFAGALNGIFGILCLTVDIFVPGQYLIAAVVSAWSMLYLWLFRVN